MTPPTPTEAEVREAVAGALSDLSDATQCERKYDVTVVQRHLRTILSALQSAQADTARLNRVLERPTEFKCICDSTGNEPLRRDIDACMYEPMADTKGAGKP